MKPMSELYSVVIPVFNSEAILGSTIDRTVEFFNRQGWAYELILVNDGSTDGSWEVLREKAARNPRVKAFNLLHNYGQHTALFCGLQRSKGDYVITMDDDLQNPPEEIVHLVEKAREGHDLVFGRFRQKQHAGYRRLGTRLINSMNQHIFDKPKDLTLSNFRIIRRDVVERMRAYKTSYPYVPGLALMFSNNPANTWVEHHSRPIGKSNYNLYKILELVMRIVFNYSSLPLRVVNFTGIAVAGLSFVLGVFYLARAIVVGISVPGWATLIVLLSFLNGLILLMLGMLGEYLVRLLNQVSSPQMYYIQEMINADE